MLPSPTSEEDTPVTVTDTAATDDIPTATDDVQQESNDATWSRLQSCLSVDVTFEDYVNADILKCCCGALRRRNSCIN